MECNFKPVVTKGISAAAQMEARFGYLQLLNQGNLQGSLTIRTPT
jgi:hypothetical protein